MAKRSLTGTPFAFSTESIVALHSTYSRASYSAGQNKIRQDQKQRNRRRRLRRLLVHSMPSQGRPVSGLTSLPCCWVGEGVVERVPGARLLQQGLARSSVALRPAASGRSCEPTQAIIARYDYECNCEVRCMAHYTRLATRRLVAAIGPPVQP